MTRDAAQHMTALPPRASRERGGKAAQDRGNGGTGVLSWDDAASRRATMPAGAMADGDVQRKAHATQLWVEAS